jgi:hypothetical protein
MKFVEAIKRLGVMLGGMLLLVVVVIGMQRLTHHRIPNWVEAILLLLLILSAYALYVRLTERRAVDELAPAAFIPQITLGMFFGLVLFATVIGLLALTGHYHYLGFAPQSPRRCLRNCSFVVSYFASSNPSVERGLVSLFLHSFSGGFTR